MLPAIGGTTTTSAAAAVADTACWIEVYPEHLSFGCVAAGYVYELKINVVNKGPKPQALRVRCDNPASFSATTGGNNHPDAPSRLKVVFVPVKIAPGVRQEFTVQLIANKSGAINFDLLITQGINKHTLSYPVKALVVPVEVFKSVAKSLALQKRPIYTNGVSVLGQIGSADDSRSVVTGRASVLSEAMMDEADVDDLLDLPLVPGTYWDAENKVMVADKELGRIFVDCSQSLEDSIERTNDLRELRRHAIEDEGNYCMETVLGMGVGAAAGAGSPTPSALLANKNRGIQDPGASYLSSKLDGEGDDEPEYPVVLAQVDEEH